MMNEQNGFRTKLLSKEEVQELSNRLYTQYAKPLEAEHWGEFIGISQDGRVIIGTDLHDVTVQALTRLGSGSFVFKVGEKAVGRI